MTQRSLVWRGLAISTLAQLLSISFISSANADNHQCGDSNEAGFIVSYSNDVEVKPNGQPKRLYDPVSDYSQISQKRIICEGDTIRTGVNSNAVVSLINREEPDQPDMRISIESNSVFTVNQQTESLDPPRTPPVVSQVASNEFSALDSAIDYCKQTINKAWLFLKQGAIHIFTEQPQSLNVNTPYMNASVEGTEFTVTVGKETVGGENIGSNATLVAVNDGKVGVCNEYGAGKLNRGESAFATEGNPPILAKVKPDNAVQWALYYPRLNPGRTDANPKAIQAYDQLVKGNIDDARQSLQGQTDDFSQALNIIIAVTQNDRETAWQLVSDALSNHPDSAPILLAKSYSQQADFDLKGALESVEMASIEDPESIIILTRLAELQQINGQAKEALVSAKSAVDKDDKVSRTHAVLGFIELSQFNIDEAKESFNKAIAIDEYDPLPRLGLGLSLIRKNDIQAGLDSMADAVILDPLNSILRAYFGKTYAEINQSDQALEQYQLAELYDPKDPTPNLFKANLYSQLNSPAAAIEELELSTNKNENRNIYRSSVDLDDDFSNRLITKSRIFNDLDFPEAVNSQISESMINSFGNANLHRYLAESYNELSNSTVIAQASEVLQSQINQTIITNPFTSNVSGPDLPDNNNVVFRESLNEYSNLFAKQGTSANLFFGVGNNSNLTDEIVLNHIGENYTIGLNQYYFSSDGFRINNDQEVELYNVFSNIRVTDSLYLQFEMFDKNENQGDLFIKFDPANFRQTFRNDRDERRYRLNLRKEFDQNTTLLATIQKGKLESIAVDTAAEFSFDEESSGTLSETQLIHKTGNTLFTAGVSYFTRDNTFVDSIMGEEFSGDFDSRHKTAYFYSLSKFGNLQSHLGLAYNELDGGLEDETNYEPKLGLMYRFNDANTIRIAAVRSFRKSLLSNQTLEPTSIAGFNQFFDDNESAKTELFGLGFDREFSTEVLGGFLATRRNVETPFISFGGPNEGLFVSSTDSNEYFYKIYLYWLPNDWNFSSSISFSHKDFRAESEETAIDDFLRLKSSQLEIITNFFISEKLRLELKALYSKQKGIFFKTESFEFEDDSDSFFSFDLGLRYKLNTNFETFLGINNIFNQDFNYQETVSNNLAVNPERTYFVNVSINF